MFEYPNPTPRPLRPLRRQLRQRNADPALDELRQAYASYQNDPEFLAEFQYELAHFVGRPSPVYHAARMSRKWAARRSI
jgi:tryptophan synthase beta chain